MENFILNQDDYVLSSSSFYDSDDTKCASVTKMYPNSNGTFRPNPLPSAYFHNQKTGYNYGKKIYNELEIYGVVIGGEKLQQLILELHDTKIDVNRQGLCFSYITNYRDRDGAFYPLHHLFNWQKYGVNVPNPPKEMWSGIGIFPQPHRFNSFDTTHIWSINQSKEIRLNADDLFISCSRDGGGPLNLWKVDRPSGHIREVRIMGKIDCHWDMSRLEVNGVTLQGDKLRSLCQELYKSQVMVNADGWCLYCTINDKYFHKLLFRFNWKTYGVQTSENCSSIWGPKYFLNEVETITILEEQITCSGEDKLIQKICVNGGAKDEQNTYGLELEKIKQEFFQKEKELKDLDLDLKKTKEEFFEKENELKDLESQLQEKKKDLRLCEKQLDEKDQELKKLIKRLYAEQTEVIIGSIYREYCNNNSFENRLQKLSAVSREMHVVLAFAKDYDDDNKHKNGEFKVFFDKNMIPELITKFKKNLPSNSSVKFFLCIGSRSEEHPFRITDKARWITNATSSLQRIIQHYGFNGIDVYYTRSSTNAKDFVDAIGKVIDKLMRHGIITTASLAISPIMYRMDPNFYDKLYNRKPNNFHYVIYQTHDDATSIPLIDAQALITIFNDLVSNHNFPKEKLLAGHSILPRDWETVPYPVIFTALPKLIKDGTIHGTSMWAITDVQP